MRWIIATFLVAVCCIGVAYAGLVDNQDGTVTDTATGLIWQKCNYGQTWSNEQCDGDAQTRTWQQALETAENLALVGREDWRLPNRNELQSLVDYAHINPAIGDILSDTTMPLAYWSSTGAKEDAGKAWFVEFEYGNIDYKGKMNSLYVRAVRAGNSDTPTAIPALSEWGMVLLAGLMLIASLFMHRRHRN